MANDPIKAFLINAIARSCSPAFAGGFAKAMQSEPNLSVAHDDEVPDYPRMCSQCEDEQIEDDKKICEYCASENERDAAADMKYDMKREEEMESEEEMIDA